MLLDTAAAHGNVCNIKIIELINSLTCQRVRLQYAYFVLNALGILNQPEALDELLGANVCFRLVVVAYNYAGGYAEYLLRVAVNQVCNKKGNKYCYGIPVPVGNNP